MDPQTRLLNAIENPKTAAALEQVLSLMESAPAEAVRLVRSFEQATAVIAKAVEDVPKCWKQLDELLLESELRRSQFTEDLRKFRKETIEETRACAEALGTLKTALQGIDDPAMNKANRVVELCEKLARAKKDGTLEILKSL